jgi:hypothetical protein
MQMATRSRLRRSLGYSENMSPRGSLLGVLDAEPISANQHTPHPQRKRLETTARLGYLCLSLWFESLSRRQLLEIPKL